MARRAAADRYVKASISPYGPDERSQREKWGEEWVGLRTTGVGQHHSQRGPTLGTMTAQVFTVPSLQRLSLAGSSAVLGPDLGEEDRAEIGRTLVELLFDLHRSGSLRPKFVDSADGRGLDLALAVPGAGAVQAQLRWANGNYELSISGDWWDDMVVAREADGRLAELYRYYFTSHVEQQRRAKERLVRGLRQLMVVNDWGLHHYQYS